MGGVTYICDLCGEEYRVTNAEDKIMIAMFGSVCPKCKESIEKADRGRRERGYGDA